MPPRRAGPRGLRNSAIHHCAMPASSARPGSRGCPAPSRSRVRCCANERVATAGAPGRTPAVHARSRSTSGRRCRRAAGRCRNPPADPEWPRLAMDGTPSRTPHPRPGAPTRNCRTATAFRLNRGASRRSRGAATTRASSLARTRTPAPLRRTATAAPRPRTRVGRGHRARSRRVHPMLRSQAVERRGRMTHARPATAPIAS